MFKILRHSSYLSANAEKDDIVMAMSAGDVYKIGQMM